MLQIFIINSFSGDETTTIGIREELEKIKDMFGRFASLLFDGWCVSCDSQKTKHNL